MGRGVGCDERDFGELILGIFFELLIWEDLVGVDRMIVGGEIRYVFKGGGFGFWRIKGSFWENEEVGGIFVEWFFCKG